MSYCGALPVDSHSSDSSILVDACLARVRKEAGLDDESVLPPLDVLVQTPPPARFVVVPAAGQLPSAEAIVRAAVKAPEPSRPLAAPRLPSFHGDEAERTGRSFVARLRWPVLLCGFLAGTFGGVALMKSPVGQKPVVQRVVKTVNHSAATAYAATTARLGR